MENTVRKVINECFNGTPTRNDYVGFLLKIRRLIPREERNATTLRMLHSQYRSEYARRGPFNGKTCLKVVFAWAMNFWEIENREEVFLKIQEQDSGMQSILDCIPEKEVTDAMIEMAVSQNEEALLFVPVHKLSVPLIKLAIEKIRASRVLRFIPRKMITKEICLFALDKLSVWTDNNPYPASNSPFHYFPRGILDEEICSKAIRTWPEEISSVPERLKTEKVCLEWVKRMEKFEDEFGRFPGHLLNKIFSLHADKGMSDFNAVKERLKTGNVNTSHEQISDDELERMFSRCQKVLEHIPERHLSICKKMFSLYWEKEIPQKIDKLIEILEKMKEHQLIVTDSLARWICAKYPELKGTEGVCEKNINKLYMNCVELKEYIFLVGNEKESPLFQSSIGRIIGQSKDKYTEQTNRTLSDINAASFVQEYLGITNYDSPKSASTGQKKKRRTKNRSTGGEEKTVWDKMITTGLLILEKTGLILQRIFATTPFTEKTRIGQIISSIWLICTIALTLYFRATVSSFIHPIVLFSLTIYSYFKIFECTIIGIAGMELAISKLNFFRCAKEVSVSSDSFQNNSMATKYDKFQLFHDYRTWQKHITYEQIQKQEQDECREVLSEHSRTTFSATS